MTRGSGVGPRAAYKFDDESDPGHRPQPRPAPGPGPTPNPVPGPIPDPNQVPVPNPAPQPNPTEGPQFRAGSVDPQQALVALRRLPGDDHDVVEAHGRVGAQARVIGTKDRVLQAERRELQQPKPRP